MTVHFTQQILTWGRLVKSWATGLDYVNADFGSHPPTREISEDAPWKLPPMLPTRVRADSPATIPRAVSLTVAQFADALRFAGIYDTALPAAVRTVIIVQGDEETMVIRIPPRAYLQQSEADLRVEAYAIPEFYNRLFTMERGPEIHPVMPTRYPDVMELHSNRIGEYTLNNCT